MNAKPTNLSPNTMTDADLDRALCTECDSILPSSGFAAAVMAAVVHEATAPAPIPFPWKRALPGLAAVIAAVALLIAAIASVAHSVAASDRATAPLWTGPAPAFLAQHGNQAMWVAAAFAIPLVCLFFCRKLIGAR
jgi:hypothetical protein